MDTTILNYVEQAVFVLEPDADGNPRYAAFNEYARKILNIPLSQVLGRTAQELYPGRLGKIAFDHHVQALKTGLPSIYEILLPVPDGKMLVRTALHPETDENGRVARVIGTSVDISGAQIFREMQAEAETMETEMEDFINLAAHDLRAPLRNVSQIAEMLREDFEDMGDGKLELIDMLEDVAEKAIGLIGDVLKHAEATSLVERTVTFDIQELVSECAALLDPMQCHQITCVPGEINGDRTAIQIILRNLLENAIKNANSVSGRRGVSGEERNLFVRVFVENHEGGFVGLRVCDNGSGFDDPTLVFLDAGKLRTESGFGLLGVRRLIHARGGSLKVTNTADTPGAEIAFTLPGVFSPPAPRRNARFLLRKFDA